MRTALSGFLFASLAACAPGSPSGDGGAASSDLIAMAGLRPDLSGPAGGVKGMFLDEKGAALNHEFISVCNPTGCHSGYTAADGSATLTHLQLVPFTFRNHEDLTATPRKGVGLVQLGLTANGMVVDAGTIYVPTLGPGAPLTGAPDVAATLSVGDGVILVVKPQDLVLPPAEDGSPLFARQVPAAHWPHFDLGGEQLVAIYALAPFSTTSMTPIAVKAPTTLAAGTVVHFRAVDEYAGVLTPPVVGHSDGKWVATDAGTGIDRLTWLLVSR